MQPKPVILLVEDSDDDAILFQRVVQKTGLGIQTRRVHNGQEGIDYLLGACQFSDRTQFPFPQVVLLDLKMPICDGFDFLTWKRSQPELTCVPTIVMTSFDFERMGRKSYELGAHAFTMKVKSSDSLADRVETLRKWWFEHCALISPSEPSPENQRNAA